MPGFEIFGDEERKQVNDVLETGVLFRYGFEGARNGHFKALEFEKKLSDLKFLENNIFKKIFKPVNSKKAHVFDLISF